MEYYYIPRPLARAQSLPFSLNSFSIQFSSVAQLCPTLCNPMECRMPGLPVHHQLPEFIQIHVHWVSDINQPSHPLSYPSSPAFNVSQHQGLFKWVSSSVAKVRWPKYWSFNISPSNEHSGLISFRTDWLDLLAVQEDFIFWASKITADDDYSHEIKINLLLGRKIMINLDSILKIRDITLPTKVHLVKAMVFPVVIYGCESWTIKNASNYWTPNICQTIVKAMVFPLVMYYCESWTIKKAGNTEELMLLNCGVGEDSWKSLGLQRDKTSQSQRKSTLNIHWKNWCWSWNSKILASWCKEPTH